MTPANVLPDVETKKLAPADLVPRQAGAGMEFTVRRGAGRTEGERRSRLCSKVS